ncbi:MAG: hypothetical protein Kapaf2KO_00370 [Candidatus Kapaibacteriales bacterium]
MTLSGLIIVRNEEESISRAIDSLSICDEIVVIDTGSEDTTIVKALSSGATVYSCTWKDSFSEARNKGIGYCSGDIIITIDADEILSPLVSKAQVLNHFRDNSVGGLECTILNITSQKGIFTKHTYTRVFRNIKGIRYQGNIHEQIRPSIDELGLKVITDGLEIYHYGYSADNGRTHRNRKLLKKELDGNRDPFYLFHLAETEFADGNLIEAQNLYNEALSQSPNSSFEGLENSQSDQAKIRLGQIALSNGNYDTTIDTLQFNSQHNDLEGFRKYVLAAVFMSTNRIIEASKLYSEEIVYNSSYTDKALIDRVRAELSKIINSK